MAPAKAIAITTASHCGYGHGPRCHHGYGHGHPRGRAAGTGTGCTLLERGLAGKGRQGNKDKVGSDIGRKNLGGKVKGVKGIGRHGQSHGRQEVVSTWRLQQEVVAHGLWVVAHGHGGWVSVAPRGGGEAPGGPPGGRGLSLPRAGVG